MFDDRSRGSECVGADAEHDGVATAHDTTRVGEHVRAALEDERDDPERSAARLERPAGVVDDLDGLVASGRRALPALESRDHVGAHRRRERQARRRATAAPGGVDVCSVRLCDRAEHRVVREQRGEPGEEVADLRVGAACQRSEAVARRGDGGVDQVVFGGGNVEQVAGVLHDDQPISRSEVGGEFGGHVGDAVAAVHDGLPRRETLETGHQSNPSSSGRSAIRTGCPLSIERCAAKPIAADRRPSINVTFGGLPALMAAAKSTCSR